MHESTVLTQLQQLTNTQEQGTYEIIVITKTHLHWPTKHFSLLRGSITVMVG